MKGNEEFEWFSNLMFSILSSNDKWIDDYEEETGQSAIKKVSNNKSFTIDPRKVNAETS